MKLEDFGTATISDALNVYGVEGGCEGILPRSQNTNISGPVFTVKFQPVSDGTFAKAADYIDNVPQGSVIVIDNDGREYCTVWGDILTQVAVIRDLAGTIIDGACRDLDSIIELNYPLFTRHVFMQTGKNKVKMTSSNEPVTISGKTVNPGDFIRADKSGVLVVPEIMVDKIISKAKEIEDIEINIIAAIKNGMTLKEARKKYNYNFKTFTK